MISRLTKSTLSSFKWNKSSEMTEVSEMHRLPFWLVIEDHSLSYYDTLSGFDYNLFILSYLKQSTV